MFGAIKTFLNCIHNENSPYEDLVITYMLINKDLVEITTRGVYCLSFFTKNTVV